MQKAFKPEEIADLFIARINDGDARGAAALFEEDAVVAGAHGQPTIRGRAAIEAFFAKILESRPHFEGVEQSPAIVHGDIALTSARLPNGFVTAEVARRQTDGSWLWFIDQPRIAERPPEA